MSRNEWRMSWGLDPLSPDAVEPHSYVFIIFIPRGNGAVNICFPEEGCGFYRC